MSSLDSESHPASASPIPCSFATTHWSVVLAAGRADSPLAAAALEKLCRSYWYPLYAYVRRSGCNREDAEDLTQEFFARILRQQDLDAVRREKGRFRSYLIVALKHFLVNEWKRGQTQKRGGGCLFIALDQVLADDLYNQEPADGQTAEKIYDRRWATTTLERVLMQLQTEYSAAGRERQFECLRDFLSGDAPSKRQAEMAMELGISEGAVKQAVHRMRQKYRELLREEIAHTVATLGDVEDEMRYLISVLRG